MPTTLISTQDLHAQVDDPKLVVVDCRFSLDDIEAGRRAYYEAHIPGAIYAHLEYDLSGWKTGSNGRHPLPTPQFMVATFSAWGIGDGTQVVVYDDAGGGMAAARLWWMLRYMGHETVAVLDGGWQAWLAAPYPTQSGINIHLAAEFAGQPRPDMVREAEAILAGGLVPIDSRTRPRYLGEQEPIDRVPGHIPGARHLYWQATLGPDGRFVKPDELRKKLAGLIGETPPEQCVFYCGSGVSAAHNVLAMEVAGLSGARLYPGSWSEWVADPDRPVATGQGT
jgi:thiosulfate/3-mercaptopyruvate sulfurtransferase